MRLLVACPAIEPPQTAPGYPTWDRPVLVIDNTARAAWARHADDYATLGTNLGVATSWNLAATIARARGADYLALISSSVVWHDGLTELDRRLEHADPDRGLLLEPLAFHGQVWSMSLLDRLGPFDENFWPAYYEDNDWVHRLEVAGEHTAANPIPKVTVNASCEDARALKAGLARPDTHRLLRYYVHKWGGPPGQELWDSPFCSGLPPSWWPVLRATPRWAGRTLPAAQP